MRYRLTPFGIRAKNKTENPYGDMYTRSLAGAIDIVCLFIIFYDYFYWMDQRYFSMIGNDFLQRVTTTTDIAERTDLISQWLTRMVIQVFFFGVAIVGCQSVLRTTPGKWIMGLKIVRAGTHEKVSTWRFLLRFLGYIVACAPLMIGMLWMEFNKERRGWHDYIAGTVVLNMRPHGWYWGKTKQAYRWLRAKLRGSAVEQPVGEPSAEQRHEDGSKPVE